MHENEDMDWQRTKCLNCDEMSAREEEQDLYDEYEDASEEGEGAVDIGYDAYGDYVYYFDDRGFDWNRDADWNSVEEEGDTMTKCSGNIPGRFPRTSGR